MDAEKYEIEDSSLLDYDLKKGLDEEIEIIEEEEEELVKADNSAAELLEKEKKLWQEGVKAHRHAALGCLSVKTLLEKAGHQVILFFFLFIKN